MQEPVGAAETSANFTYVSIRRASDGLVCVHIPGPRSISGWAFGFRVVGAQALVGSFFPFFIQSNIEMASRVAVFALMVAIGATMVRFWHAVASAKVSNDLCFQPSMVTEARALQFLQTLAIVAEVDGSTHLLFFGGWLDFERARNALGPGIRWR